MDGKSEGRIRKVNWLPWEKRVAALFLAIGAIPVLLKFGAVKVRAQERADNAEYVAGQIMVSLRNYEAAAKMSSEDFEIALWTIQQGRKNGRYLPRRTR